MLYSPANKIGHILHNFNIKEFSHDYTLQGYTCLLENLESGLTTVLDSNMPLYNVLYAKRTIVYPPPVNGHEQAIEEYQTGFKSERLISADKICLKTANFAKSKAIFNKDFDLDISAFSTTYTTSPYYQRHKTIHHGNNIYSYEYMPYYSLSDVTSIVEDSGVGTGIKQIIGKFYIDTNDDLRLVITPTKKILEDVKDVFFSNFNIFYSGGYNFSNYLVIYTTNSDENNVKLFYYNGLINNLTSKGTFEISLSSIFLEHQPDIKIDMANDSLINNKFFIVQSLFNFGIFLNIPSGIVRFIPTEFTSQFFNIIFNNMGIHLDYDFKYYTGAIPYDIKKNVSGYTETMTPNILGNSITPLLKDNKILAWSSFSNIDNFSTMLSLTSNADFYNDLIFSISEAGDSLTVPIFLVNGI